MICSFLPLGLAQERIVNHTKSSAVDWSPEEVYYNTHTSQFVHSSLVFKLSSIVRREQLHPSIHTLIISGYATQFDWRKKEQGTSSIISSHKTDFFFSLISVLISISQDGTFCLWWQRIKQRECVLELDKKCVRQCDRHTGPTLCNSRWTGYRHT